MPKTPRTLISIVVPVYNEEDAIPPFLEAIRHALAEVTDDYEIIFAADPCSDRTTEIVQAEHAGDSRVKLLVFSRRFGQHAATMGGMTYASGQAVVVIDCDLQDPPSLIPEMVRLWRAGFKVVIPQRRSRRGESFLKVASARLHSWLLNSSSTLPIPRDVGDFRLLDRVVVKRLLQLRESHAFLRGLTSIVGYKTQFLPFERIPRTRGEAKYPFGKLFRVGLNSLLAFSDRPLTLIVYLGVFLAMLAIAGAGAVAYLKASGAYGFVTGLATVAILMLFLNGIQLVCVGVLGAYIGRIYAETKRRPMFLVEESVGFSADPDAARRARPVRRRSRKRRLDTVYGPR